MLQKYFLLVAIWSFSGFRSAQLSCMILKSMNLLHLVDAREECLRFAQHQVFLPWQRQFPLNDLLFPISSSMIFCCFWIKSSDLLVRWFCCCWDVGGAGVSLMLVVLDFLEYFFVSYSSFIHNKGFINNHVTICEISLYMTLSSVIATNHLVITLC